jgi:hypothetical protein
MRTFLIIIALFPLIVFGQEWQTLYSSDYSNTTFFGSSGNYLCSKNFKINPYNNDIWMARGNKIQLLDANGDYSFFNYLDFPILEEQSIILDFDFTPSYTYFIDRYYGLYRWSNNSVEAVYLGDAASEIGCDGDTVWVGRVNKNYVVANNESVTEGVSMYLRRIVSRNGNLWFSPSTSDGSIGKLINNNLNVYYANSTLLLDDKNYDFKFARLTDSLYTSGDRGLSIAYGSTFIDTITNENSSNMPSGAIIEFEFDSKDNIWALFGNQNGIGNSIAYYNQLTNNWSQYYDASNSPIDFTFRISIEIDTLDNLWVSNTDKLHVLKLESTPAWLATQTLPDDEIGTVYPNPSTNYLNIKNPENIASFSIKDMEGRELMKDNFNKTIAISSLKSGCYFITFNTKDGKISNRKFVKN